MNDAETLQRLKDELVKTLGIIDYLEYQLMTKRAWKSTTEFRITKILSSNQSNNEGDDQ